ncbi:Recombinase [Planctomycetales bacterium 10988]|nr:Recombinase [Planctomycetales bacterium 10988]
MSRSTHTMLQPPLEPRNGRELKVLAICRISTIHQDARSLEDQETMYRHWLTKHTSLPFRMEVIASQGSGEALDRKEYHRAIELVESDQFDLVISEDLGRICRRVHAHIFCEICEDSATRLIALNDHVDTALDDWRLGSFFAVMRHETSNRDTSRRIRRSLRNRFSQGGVVQTTIYGYIKPRGENTDDKLHKDPDAEPIYEEWFQRLENGESLQSIADWLNGQGIPVGPYVRVDQWSGPLVGRVTRNPILKGVRVRNRKISRRVNRTGRRQCIDAPPEERLERHCPHLAFIEPQRYDRIVQQLNDKNEMYRRGRAKGVDCRKNVPLRRTRFPGQMVDCGICGHKYVFGGHGQTDHLMCNGARGYHCWNGVSFDSVLAAMKISEAVFSELEALPDFDSAFLTMVQEESQKANGQRAEKLRSSTKEVERLDRELANLLKFIREGSSSNTLQEELVRIESEKSNLEYEIGCLKKSPVRELILPTAKELRELARSEFAGLAQDSYEFASLMRRLIPKLVVFPCQLCDGGQILLRAKFRLKLSGLLSDAHVEEVLATPLERVLTVDLFEPVQRAAFREEILRLKASLNPKTGKNHTEEEVSQLLGITRTAAQRSASMQRKMDRLGITDPYIPILEPPKDNKKLCRHKHKRYSFQPLESAGQI